MSEHKHNLTALMHATLPALLPPGFSPECRFLVQVVPKPTVAIIPPGAKAGEGWTEPPEGTEAHEAGVLLDIEKCDVTIILVVAAVEQVPRGIVGLDGKPRSPQSAVLVSATLMRADLLDWMASFDAQMGR